MATPQTASHEAEVPPPLQGPTAKEKKYDRQLRLWAASGQQALEEAHVLLLNNGSGVTGVETLKNLILPGIGEFTIVDDHNVDEPDLGVNFFLEEESLGKSRAEESVRFLRELNPEVKGNAIQKSISDFVNDADLSKYTLIILVSPVDIEPIVKQVAEFCWEKSIPLFWVHCFGFYFSFAIQLPRYFPIVETHPDPVSTQDLRLLKPWPELLNHMKDKTSSLDELSDHDHGHVPYLLLLLHYLQEYHREHGKYPDAYKEKTEFRKMVQAGARTSNPEGGEENFDEAVAAVLKSLNPPTAPSSLKDIWNKPECHTLQPDASNFFIIANALLLFHTRHGVLPLPGSIPDMKAQSADYVALQNLYRSKSAADIAEVTTIVRKIEVPLSRIATIPAKEIEAFSKGASWVKLLEGRPLVFPLAPATKEGEPPVYNFPTDTTKRVSRELTDPDSNLPIHLAALAVDQIITDEQTWADSTKGTFTTWEHYMSGRYQDYTDGTKKWLHVGSTPSRAFDRLAQSERMIMWQYAGVNEEHEEVKIARDYNDTDGYVSGLYFAALWAALDPMLRDLEEEDKDQAQERLRDVCREIARSGPGELHNVASLAGGMVSQEVIKVVTRQYVPVDNTCVFDGIKSKVQVLKL